MSKLPGKQDASCLKRLYSQNGISFYAYKPTLFSPLYLNFEHMTVQRRVRLLLEYLHRGKYTVYYLEKDQIMVGYCVAAKGGRRLKCTTEQDVVLGPFYVDPSFRGKGYGTKLIDFILHKSGISYHSAYDYIRKNNIPSIRATRSCGFQKIGELNIVGFFHHLVETENGEFKIYQYTLP